MNSFFRHILLSTVLLFMVCSCATSDVLPCADLNSLEGKECSVSVDDIYSSVEIIPMETSDSCLLSYPGVVAFDDNGFLVLDRGNVYRFDNKGRFVNRIGRLGHGYGEYVNANSVNWDCKRKIVFVGTFANEIYKYDFSGKFLGKFSVSGGDDALLTSDWCEALGLYVCEIRKYSQNGVEVLLTTWTQDGKKVGSYPVYKDDKTVDRNYTETGSLRAVTDGVLFKLPFCNTVYKLTKEGLSECFELDFGSHSMTRDLLEDRSKYERQKNKYVIRNWELTGNNLYLQIVCDDGERDVLVRRSDMGVQHNQLYKYNDNSHHLKVKGLSGDATFWPDIAKGDKVVGLVRNKDKNANPVIVVAKEKKVKSAK